MRTLAIDCATEACSVALFDQGRLIAGEFRVLGRGHAEQLVPMIAQLPERGKAQRVAVSLGPGSFTGVRIGIAAARALGLAWKCEVLGYPTLALVAAIARELQPGAVSVAMTGGHGEWFVQDFAADGLPQSELLSAPPEVAARHCRHSLVAGSKAGQVLEYASGHTALEILPDARKFALVPPALLRADPAPIYGRPPNARLPGAAA